MAAAPPDGGRLTGTTSRLIPLVGVGPTRQGGGPAGAGGPGPAMASAAAWSSIFPSMLTTTSSSGPAKPTTVVTNTMLPDEFGGTDLLLALATAPLPAAEPVRATAVDGGPAEILREAGPLVAGMGFNEQQMEAVLCGGGPVAVLAGPGSGKTRVLVGRLAHLLGTCRIAPHRVIAVTFTNKAASELYGCDDRNDLWVHRGVGLQIAPDENCGARGGAWPDSGNISCIVHQVTEAVRGMPEAVTRDTCCNSYGKVVNIVPDFIILDESARKGAVNDAIRECKEASPDDFENIRELAVPFVSSEISFLKNKAVTGPEAVATLQSEHSFQANLARVVVNIYDAYQRHLAAQHLLDFDDLLLATVRLLEEHAECRATLARSCEHLLIDEFQDTNGLQYRIAKCLCSVHRNLFVVGDPDQAIYSWRHAGYNLDQLRAEFPDLQIYKLEVNYRSTGHILHCANAIIGAAGTKSRHEQMAKTMRAHLGDGQLVQYWQYVSGLQEANAVAAKIRDIQHSSPSTSIAILYRTAVLSRAFEEALRAARVPFTLLQGVQFYQKAEIRPLICYLQLVHNPHDSIAFSTAITTPKRGIGATTVEALRAAALSSKTQASMLEVCQSALRDMIPGLSLNSTQRGSLSEFVRLLFKLKTMDTTRKPAAAIVQTLLDAIKYEQCVKATYPDPKEFTDRWDNVQELLSAAKAADTEDAVPPAAGVDQQSGDGGAAAIPQSALGRLLEVVALVADPATEHRSASACGTTATKTPVVLSTMHAAKGLEWDSVFLPALEDGIVPHHRTQNVEEERRLLFVAMTRAQRFLYMSNARSRVIQGSDATNAPSSFLRLPVGHHTAHLLDDSDEETATAIATAIATATSSTTSYGFGAASRQSRSFGADAAGFQMASAVRSGGGRENPGNGSDVEEDAAAGGKSGETEEGDHADDDDRWSQVEAQPPSIVLYESATDMVAGGSRQRSITEYLQNGLRRVDRPKPHVFTQPPKAPGTQPASNRGGSNGTNIAAAASKGPPAGGGNLEAVQECEALPSFDPTGLTAASSAMNYNASASWKRRRPLRPLTDPPMLLSKPFKKPRASGQ